MKYIWEKNDLKNSWGRYVISSRLITREMSKTPHRGITNLYKIGGDGIKYILICMGDGFIYRYNDCEELLARLNGKDEFRPARKQEVLDMIEHNWDYHEGIK